jgi:hypothetical protein
MIETLNGLTLSEVMCQTREERLVEVGTMPPCPYCEKPRVQRSLYVRCNPCGKNWVQGSDLSKHPHTRTTSPLPTETSDGAQHAS